MFTAFRILGLGFGVHLEHGGGGWERGEQAGAGELHEVVAQAQLPGVAGAVNEALALFARGASLRGHHGGGELRGGGDILEVLLREGRGWAAGVRLTNGITYTPPPRWHFKS